MELFAMDNVERFCQYGKCLTLLINSVFGIMNDNIGNYISVQGNFQFIFKLYNIFNKRILIVLRFAASHEENYIKQSSVGAVFTLFVNSKISG